MGTTREETVIPLQAASLIFSVAKKRQALDGRDFRDGMAEPGPDRSS